jgi:hypothetical protein
MSHIYIKTSHNKINNIYTKTLNKTERSNKYLKLKSDNFMDVVITGGIMWWPNHSSNYEHLTEGMDFKTGTVFLSVCQKLAD